MILVGVSKGALSAIALVPAGAAAKGLSAKDWLAEALVPTSGKGGGNASRSQGASREAKDVPLCVEMANKLAAAKLS